MAQIPTVEPSAPNTVSCPCRAEVRRDHILISGVINRSPMPEPDLYASQQGFLVLQEYQT